jgi:hypothetical protein
VGGPAPIKKDEKNSRATVCYHLKTAHWHSKIFMGGLNSMHPEAKNGKFLLLASYERAMVLSGNVLYR